MFVFIVIYHSILVHCAIQCRTLFIQTIYNSWLGGHFFFFFIEWCSLSLSRVRLCDPMDCSLPRHLCPWGFSRQEYWSGFPCTPPGDLPNPGIERRSPALYTNSFPSEPPGGSWGSF